MVAQVLLELVDHQVQTALQVLRELQAQVVHQELMGQMVVQVLRERVVSMDPQVLRELVD